MITDEKVARINELARKSRTAEGLTEEEKAEQASLAGHLDNTVVLNPDGTKKKLKQKD